MTARRSSSTFGAKDKTFETNKDGTQAVGEPFLFANVGPEVICTQLAGLWQRNEAENQGRPLNFRVEAITICCKIFLSF